ncbi:MAG: hypothetical protein R2795_02915 [Saprospiraceae bacterium]
MARHLYTFFVNGVAQTGLTANGLGTGSYQLLVSDATGCQTQSQASISGTTAPMLQPQVTPTSCGADNGAILAEVTGIANSFSI